MSKPYIILSSWPSFCQKLLKLVEICQSCDKKFDCFLTHGVYRHEAVRFIKQENHEAKRTEFVSSADRDLCRNTAFHCPLKYKQQKDNYVKL